MDELSSQHSHIDAPALSSFDNAQFTTWKLWQTVSIIGLTPIVAYVSSALLLTVYALAHADKATLYLFGITPSFWILHGILMALPLSILITSGLLRLLFRKNHAIFVQLQETRFQFSVWNTSILLANATLIALLLNVTLGMNNYTKIQENYIIVNTHFSIREHVYQFTDISRFQEVSHSSNRNENTTRNIYYVIEFEDHTRIKTPSFNADNIPQLYSTGIGFIKSKYPYDIEQFTLQPRNSP